MFKAVGIAMLVIASVQVASAQVQIKTLQATGMAALKKSVVKHGKTPSAEGCPESGSEEVVVNFTKKSTLTDIESAMSQASAAVSERAKSLAKDGSKCGACKQLNVVSPASMILPQIDSEQEANTQKACTRYPINQFTKKFASMEEGQTFILDAFKKNNAEGEKMYDTCPDPCSFYVYVATTNLSGGRKSLNMTVQCGPPKVSEGFLGMDSTYDLSTRVIHEWTCAKAE